MFLHETEKANSTLLPVSEEANVIQNFWNLQQDQDISFIIFILLKMTVLETQCDIDYYRCR